MSKKIIDNFDIRTRLPLDKRTQVNSLNDIDMIFEGLITYQETDKKFYYFDENYIPHDFFSQLDDTFINKVDVNSIYFNVKDFGAKGDGVTDDTLAIQTCINTAQAQKGSVLFQQGTYKITSPLLVSANGVSLTSAGGKTEQATLDFHITTDFGIHVTSPYNCKISNLTLNMNDSTGGAIYLDKGAGHEISNLVVRGSTTSNANVIKITAGAVIFDNNNISSLNTSARGLNCYGVTSQVNINSRFTRNTFGGTGLGMIVDADDNTRCEGMMITDNVFLNSGQEQLTITKVLYAHITNNLFDNGGNYCIWFVPKDLGINGVVVTNNYISPAQASLEGIGINFTNNGTFGTTKIIIANNCFMYSGYGITCSSQYIEGVLIDGNTFSDMHHEGISVHGSKNVIIKNNMCMDTATYSFTLSDSTTGGKYIVRDNIFKGAYVITKTTPSNFIIGDNIGITNPVTTNIASSTFTATSISTQTCVIPHGLSSAPDITKCLISVLQNGSGAEFSGCWIVSADSTNVTCQVKVSYAGTGQGKIVLLASL